MRPSEKAWLALGTAIILYEVVAEEGEMLTHAVDGWRRSHRVITVATIVSTTLHLLRLMPPAVDPWVLAFRWRKLLRG